MAEIVMIPMSRQELKELLFEVMSEREQSKKAKGENLITYREIAELYNIKSETTISRKVNEAKLEQYNAYYGGRLRIAITRDEAEKLFKKRKTG